MTSAKKEYRKKFRNVWERNWIRDSFRLRDKKPEETLKAMFDLCRFAEKLNRLGKK